MNVKFSDRRTPLGGTAHGAAPPEKFIVFRFALGSIVSLALLVTLGAQTPTTSSTGAVKLQPGETPVPGECLTREELDLNDRLHALTRPTRGAEAGRDADDSLQFNPSYLAGKWNVEGVVPDSALGSAGDISGVDIVRHLRDCTYESTLQVKGGGLTYTVKSLVVFDRHAGYMVRSEQDSRGFQILKIGIVGGDAGGYFSHHWQTAEFTYKGKRVRLLGTSFYASPEDYRVRMQIAVDDQPFVAYGTLWWRRDGSTTSGAKYSSGAK
jgi:hypothetical protein